MEKKTKEEIRKDLLEQESNDDLKDFDEKIEKIEFNSLLEKSEVDGKK